MSFFSNLRQRRSPALAWTARTPPKLRLYAIGDIHGEVSKLSILLDAIRDDAAGMPCGYSARIICLGDYIDRGPNSRGVIQKLLDFSAEGWVCRFLRGNHEAAFERYLNNGEGVETWLRNGGIATCMSYGIDPTAPRQAPLTQWLQGALQAALPERHRAFFDGLADLQQYGDYLFVHAGIRPGTPIEAQRPEDLHWIRDPFLRSKAEHGAIVVHGHTPVEQAEFRSNRIGIDTGACYGGVLTALVLDGDDRWMLQAGPRDATRVVAPGDRVAAG